MSAHEEPRKVQDLLRVHVRLYSDHRLPRVCRWEVVACVRARRSPLCRIFVLLFFQEAVDENEQKKKQEEAMREKLLAQEAKQHDPKVTVLCTRSYVKK